MNAHVSPDRTRAAEISHLTALACGNVNADGKWVCVAKPGRPPAADPTSERSRKPWIAEGISQRTYYRRKAVAAASAPEPPQQHAAHVTAWFATLGLIAQLEHRAFIRRCVSAASKPLSLPEL